MNTISVAFVCSLRNSVRQAVQQLSISESPMYKIMQSCLHIKSCKYQLFQHVTAQGEDVHYKFFCDLCQNMKDKKNAHMTNLP